MDKFSKLRALTGQEDVVQRGEPTETIWFSQANNIYEGTDSEDDDEIVMIKQPYHAQSTAGFISSQDGMCLHKPFLILLGLVC